MFTKKHYSIRQMVYWTHRETVVFIVIAAIPVMLHEVLDQRWLHLPWLPIALIGTAVAFIIGFQNNATYGRLWEARKIWGGIVNVSRAWALQVNDFITNDFAETPSSDEELREVRTNLIERHLAWLTALRHAMRQPRTWETFQQQKTNRTWSEMIGVHEHGVSVHEDMDTFVAECDRAFVGGKTNLPAQLLALQSRILGRLRTRGLLDDFRHMEMQQLLTNLLDLQGRSERIKNFPYPRQYATLNSHFLWIFVLMLPFGVMFEFSKIGEQLVSDHPTVGGLFVWLSIPFSVVVMWVFHTMERIGRVSENPFEGSPNDVPITSMSRGIEIDLREILGQPKEAIPDPIQPVEGALT